MRGPMMRDSDHLKENHKCTIQPFGVCVDVIFMCCLSDDCMYYGKWLQWRDMDKWLSSHTKKGNEKQNESKKKKYIWFSRNVSISKCIQIRTRAIELRKTMWVMVFDLNKYLSHTPDLRGWNASNHMFICGTRMQWLLVDRREKTKKKKKRNPTFHTRSAEWICTWTANNEQQYSSIDR